LTAMDDLGQTLVDYALYDAYLAGVEEAVIVVSREGRQAFDEAVGRRLSRRLRLRYAEQTSPVAYGFDPTHPPLGTGHAFLCGVGQIKTPFVVLNADDYYGRAAIGQAVACAKGGGYGVVSYPAGQTVKQEPVHRGICLTEGRRLTGICECVFARDGAGKLYAEDATCRKYLPENTPVNMNLYAMQPEVRPAAATSFAAFLQRDKESECFLGDIVTDFVGRTHQIVHHIRAKSRWLGITYREDVGAVRRYLAKLRQSGVYPMDLWR